VPEAQWIMQQTTQYTDSREAALREEMAAAEARIAELERTVAVYGELLDEFRNRVYVLKHRRA
jgi:hypothetical protein